MRDLHLLFKYRQYSMDLDQRQIEALDRKFKLNLINSLSGIKSANLIGTISSDGKENVAIFSSVIHIGSSPAQLGFILRPQEEIPRDTYANIKATNYYTINHINSSFVEKAHYTSAKLARGESEFDRMKIESAYIGDFPAPFVKESHIKIGMKHSESVPISNGGTLVIGTVELLQILDSTINELGQIDLEKSLSMGISGLNTYYNLVKKESFPYVRTSEIPNF